MLQSPVNFNRPSNYNISVSYFHVYTKNMTYVSWADIM